MARKAVQHQVSEQRSGSAWTVTSGGSGAVYWVLRDPDTLDMQCDCQAGRHGVPCSHTLAVKLQTKEINNR
jgi:hypothetical protein